MRILVTGSRDWDDEMALRDAIFDEMGSALVTGELIQFMHGDCPTGADYFADRLAAMLANVSVVRFPAGWEKYGKAAGFRRNAEMVSLGADICLAFIKNNSKGATHTADLAEKAGIPTRRFTA